MDEERSFPSSCHIARLHHLIPLCLSIIKIKVSVIICFKVLLSLKKSLSKMTFKSNTIQMEKWSHFLKNYNFIYLLFILGYDGSFVVARAFLQLKQAGASLQLQYMGFSFRWHLLLLNKSSRVRRASGVAAHGLISCSSQGVKHRL